MNVLEKILQTKQEELASARYAMPLKDVKARAGDLEPARPFVAAFRGKSDLKRLRVIAEIKKASPSKGVIRPDFDPLAIAAAYREGGATAFSVLTDKLYFQGDIAYLAAIRAREPLAILRKDFTIDAYQVYESRVAGADAMLLIAAILSTHQMADYIGIANELGMGALVEIHDEADLAKVRGLSGDWLLGINNRDLKTFSVSLDTSFRLASLLPPGFSQPLVSESGLSNREDLVTLSAAGFSGFLIGESLMRKKDVKTALSEWVGNIPAPREK